MNKCESWINPPNPYSDARCLATKETEWCSCGGDQTKCDFYPEYREKAKMGHIGTQELAPVRHGQWIWTESDQDDYEQYWVCSECGERNYYQSNYCPDCGAKMDGGSDDGKAQTY